MIDMIRALFQSGVPYDADRNTFEVRPEYAYLIEQQRAQIAEEQARSVPIRDYTSDWYDY
jgi:hypothetical protein